MFWKNKNKPVVTDEVKIDEILSRGVEEVIDRDNLKKRMLAGERLRIKLGIDPTSSNIHLGRSIPLLKLRDFQQMGHQVVFIIGDFTGRTGDTSDKDSERPALAREEVQKNLKTYKSQVGKLIDFDSAEIHYNSTWLSKLSFEDTEELARIFSLNQFISRELIAKRLKEGKRISLHETFYPLMQGYDSVQIRADVELGGTDQKFNMLAGRDIQKHFRQKEQAIITGPIIEGTDGRKMSSSWGNTINFNDEPEDMYGKVMSVHDELVLKYFELLTRVEHIEELRSIKENDPKQAKMLLAKEIVAMYHGREKAGQAEQHWVGTFSEGGIPTDLQEISVQKGSLFVEIFDEHKLLPSKTEFRRRAKAGAIKNAESGEKMEEDGVFEADMIVKYGKKDFVRILKK